MVYHKKKAAKARKWRLAAINVALNKFRLLKEELERMLAWTTKPVRITEADSSGRLVEVPVTEEDRAAWGQQLALIVEKERVLLAEREEILAWVPPPHRGSN